MHGGACEYGVGFSGGESFCMAAVEFWGIVVH